MKLTLLRPATLALLAALFFSAAGARAEYLASIIIDDIGQSYERVADIINADIPLTLAILPQTLFAETIAEQAHRRGKEIMVHLPMQSIRHHNHSPGTLTLHMTEQEFIQQLKQDIDSVPHVTGVNNHMGSLMTMHPGYMSWLMRTLADYDGMYFIDSRTTDQTVAAAIADEYNVPNLERDVFLDPEQDAQTLEQQFQRFIDKAKTNGTAIAIAHPHPLSIQYILNNVDRLQQNGIRLAPVSRLIQLRQQARHHTPEVDNHVTCTGAACAGM